MTVVADPARPVDEPDIPGRRTTTARLLAWKPLPHLGLAMLFTTAWVLLSVLRELHSGDPTYDNAIFTEAVKGWATRGAPIVDIKGAGFNLLGDHWSPILAVLAPAWLVWPSTLMIVTAQAFLFGWSVGIVSDTAARLLGRTRGLGVAVAYGLSFGLQQGLDVGFHEWAFAVPLLAVAGRQLVLDQPARAFWWALPLLLVKEDMGPVVAVFGLLIAWRWRRWTLAGVLVVAGLGSTVLDIFVLIPHFNPLHRYDYFTGAYNVLPHKDWWEIPLRMVWPFAKWQTLGWTFGITAFVCLRSPVMWLAAPILAWRFAATDPGFWNIGWHYSETMMPIVFVAAADGLDRMQFSRRPWERWYRRQAVPGMVFTAVALTVGIPLGVSTLFDTGTYRQTPLDKAYLAADAAIPPNVTVSAPVAMLSVLAAKDDLAWQAANDPKATDWWAPDFVCNDDTFWIETDPVQWAGWHYHGTYRIVFQRDAVTCMERAS